MVFLFLFYDGGLERTGKQSGGLFARPWLFLKKDESNSGEPVKNTNLVKDAAKHGIDYASLKAVRDEKIREELTHRDGLLSIQDKL